MRTLSDLKGVSCQSPSSFPRSGFSHRCTFTRNGSESPKSSHRRPGTPGRSPLDVRSSSPWERDPIVRWRRRVGTSYLNRCETKSCIAARIAGRQQPPRRAHPAQSSRQHATGVRCDPFSCAEAGRVQVGPGTNPETVVVELTGEPFWCLEQTCVTLIETRHKDVTVTHVALHHDTPPVRRSARQAEIGADGEHSDV